MASPHSLLAAQPRTGSLYVRLSVAADGSNLSKDGMIEDCVRLCEAEGIAASEEAVAAALEALSKEATAEAFKDLQDDQRRREAACNAPRVVHERVIKNGRTMREAWESTADNPEARRDLLRANYTWIMANRTAPDNRGSKAWNPRRVVMLASPPIVLDHTEHTYRHGAAVVDPADEHVA